MHQSQFSERNPIWRVFPNPVTICDINVTFGVKGLKYKLYIVAYVTDWRHWEIVIGDTVITGDTGDTAVTGDTTIGVNRPDLGGTVLNSAAVSRCPALLAFNPNFKSCAANTLCICTYLCSLPCPSLPGVQHLEL